jgi:hypothetical protein
LPIKLIVSDLDRTLLRTDKSLSNETAGVLARCRERGIKVAFATARSEKSCERFTGAVNPDAMVSNGGALARCGETVVYRRAIPRGSADALLRSCAGAPYTGYITVDTVSGGFYVNRGIDPADVAWKDFSHCRVYDLAAGVDGDVYKMSVQYTDGALFRETAAAYPDLRVLPFSGEGWFSVSHREATKWEAVRRVAEHFGIPASEVAAFGDDYNDIEMLKECGAGVAVSNAIEEARAAAGYICGSNDSDGVAGWIEENILKTPERSKRL